MKCCGSRAGQLGFAQTLDRDLIGCVLLDDAEAIQAGDTVRGTGAVIRDAGRSRPARSRRRSVGTSAGRRPADRRRRRTTPIEAPAPSIIERELVTEPVQTGILTIDALFALGRGQRELIIGDRGTGKTAIAVDTIINQRDSDLICVYIAVGQKSSAVARVIDAVRQHGAPERCIFVVAAATASPGLQWIAPFAGMTMAEYFRDRGQHALVVIDDLTKHAATHREIALLTHQPPGREAFPGDIFYLHARLLERAAKLSAERGGGSLTALPIAETDAGNLSAYIPTNLISITDGQLVLNARLFQEGHKPAIDIGTSVSRVGGKTQAPALREAAGTMRLEYAQFLELEMFSRFGGAAGCPRQGATGARRAAAHFAVAAAVRAVAAGGRGGAGDRAARRHAGCGRARAGSPALRAALPAWLDAACRCGGRTRCEAAERWTPRARPAVGGGATRWRSVTTGTTPP